jgi:Flp pilus assembly protein TadD
LPTYRDSIGPLRLALKHPDEDVRLVAHTILESKSRAAYRAVHEADCALREAPEDKRAEHCLRLAGLHFELVRLGLADGDCRTAALQQASTHARAALERTPRDRSAHFLLGRIELQRRDGEAAEASLERAVELGLLDPIARPYLAESAFLRGRLDLVRRHFARVPRHSNLVVEQMARYWA